VRRQYNAPVLAIVSMTDIIDYLAEQGDAYQSHLAAMRAYRQQYGAA
jgi:orotate phosphoribosyltransferase